MMKKNNLPTLSEAEEQTLLVQYLELRKLKFTAFAQSTWTQSWAQKNKNKRIGVRPGFPDLVIVIPYEKNGFKENRLLFCEMKKKDAPGPRPEQKEWLDALNKVAGVWVSVAFGFDAAKEFIEKIEKTDRMSK